MAVYLIVGQYNSVPDISSGALLRHLRFSAACQDRQINGGLEIYQAKTSIRKLHVRLIKVLDPDIITTDLTLVLIKPVLPHKIDDTFYVEAMQERVVKFFVDQLQQVNVNYTKDFPTPAHSHGDVAWTVKDVVGLIEEDLASPKSRFKRVV